MGKFNLKKIGQRIRVRDKQERKNIRKKLKERELIELIGDEDNPTDGILKFGKHYDKKVSYLVSHFDLAPYVYNYLASHKDLPKKFKDSIKKILMNLDPFDDSGMPSSQSSLNIREIAWEPPEDDDIPF